MVHVDIEGLKVNIFSLVMRSFNFDRYILEKDQKSFWVIPFSNKRDGVPTLPYGQLTSITLATSTKKKYGRSKQKCFKVLKINDLGRKYKTMLWIKYMEEVD